jgi:hypothetical protein
MKITMNHATYFAKGVEEEIILTRYTNGRLVVALKHPDDAMHVVTVNLPDHELPEGHAFFKVWGVSEGILLDFLDAGWIEQPEITVASGFVHVPMVKLKGELAEAAAEYMKQFKNEAEDQGQFSCVLTIRCFKCNGVNTLSVPKSGIDKYKQGAHIQEAFPELSSDEREMMLSGLCPACFAELFGEMRASNE